MQAFVVEEDIRVAKGVALANPHLEWAEEPGNSLEMAINGIDRWLDRKVLKMISLISYFSSDDGIFRTNDQVLVFPGLTRSEFDRGLGKHMNGGKSAPDYFVYGPISVMLWGHPFSVGFRFFKDVVQGVTLTLERGRVAALGYDATEKDLLTEKKILTTMISKHLACLPSSTSLGADVFEFPWGGLVSRADEKSTWCGIEVWYR